MHLRRVRATISFSLGADVLLVKAGFRANLRFTHGEDAVAGYAFQDLHAALGHRILISFASGYGPSPKRISGSLEEAWTGTMFCAVVLGQCVWEATGMNFLYAQVQEPAAMY